MLSVRVPESNHSIATAGFICTDIYIVPRRDGRIVIGATSEEVDLHPQHPSWYSSLTTSDPLYPHYSTIPSRNLVGFRPRRQMSYPFLALALQDFNACHRSLSQWHSCW